MRSFTSIASTLAIVIVALAAAVLSRPSVADEPIGGTSASCPPFAETCTHGPGGAALAGVDASLTEMFKFPGNCPDGDCFGLYLLTVTNTSGSVMLVVQDEIVRIVANDDSITMPVTVQAHCGSVDTVFELPVRVRDGNGQMLEGRVEVSGGCKTCPIEA